MSTKTGIWIDGNQALLVDITNHEVTTRTIPSEVDHLKPHGGYGGKNKALAQDARPDGQVLNRRKEQEAHYYKAVIEAVKDSAELLIMGPGEIKTGLKAEIAKHHRGFEVKDVIAADKMTENQLKEKVKAYFGEPTRQEPNS